MCKFSFYSLYDNFKSCNFNTWRCIHLNQCKSWKFTNFASPPHFHIVQLEYCNPPKIIDLVKTKGKKQYYEDNPIIKEKLNFTYLLFFKEYFLPVKGWNLCSSFLYDSWLASFTITCNSNNHSSNYFQYP